MSNGDVRRLTLGKVAGIPVHVSPSWFIVAAVITVGFAPVVDRYLPGLGGGAYVLAFTFAVLLYASVLLHEISHALTARALGLPVRGITLHFLGGYTEIERESPTPGRDIIVSAAGPAVSLVVAGIAALAALPVDQRLAEFLLLQGQPIGAPVFQMGPFVMNSAEEIQQALVDYRSTEFGGWPWPNREPVHHRTSGRFALHADGRVEERDRPIRVEEPAS